MGDYISKWQGVLSQEFGSKAHEYSQAKPFVGVHPRVKLPVAECMPLGRSGEGSRSSTTQAPTTGTKSQPRADVPAGRVKNSFSQEKKEGNYILIFQLGIVGKEQTHAGS